MEIPCSTIISNTCRFGVQIIHKLLRCLSCSKYIALVFVLLKTLYVMVQERKHRHKHHKHRSDAGEEAVAEADVGDSGEKKRRHRKKREEEGADAV